MHMGTVWKLSPMGDKKTNGSFGACSDSSRPHQHPSLSLTIPRTTWHLLVSECL